MGATLGPSGSGKTTLLDLLAGRKTSGRIDPASRVFYDGARPSAAYLRRNVGYVEQQDTLLGMLTPYEMLLYTAELTHPVHEPKKQKRAQVAALINELGLQDCQDTVIGNPARRGISGGEAKRVNIGIALITRPHVLLLDEVTSGLDSYTGQGVVEVVKSLATSGITVMATIHSPTPVIFEMFDRILLLQKGRVVFFGPNGDPALEYFSRVFPDLRTIRRAEGNADFLLDITTRANKVEGQAAALADGYAASALCAANQQTIDAAISGCNSPDIENGGAVAGTGTSAHSKALSASVSSTATPMWWALTVLWRYRSFKAYRQAAFIAPRLFDKVVVVFLVVTLWWGIGDNMSLAGAIAGVLFLWSMLSAFASMGILATLVIERPVFTRERSDGLYRPATYVIYKVVEELLPQVPAGLAYSALVFYLVGLQGSFLTFWLVYLVATANSIGMTFFVSASSGNTSVAGAFLSSYATTLFFFSGYLLPIPDMGPWWQWYAYIDPLRYAFGSMMVNQFGPAGSENDPVWIGGKTILGYYGLGSVDKWQWLGFETLFFPGYVGLLWLSLVLWKHQQR